MLGKYVFANVRRERPSLARLHPSRMTSSFTRSERVMNLVGERSNTDIGRRTGRFKNQGIAKILNTLFHRTRRPYGLVEAYQLQR